MLTIFSKGNEPGTGMFIGMITIFDFFAAIMGSTYYYTRTRNMERMGLIERGVDLSAFYKKTATSSKVLTYGLLIMGLALGKYLSETSINSLL